MSIYFHQEDRDIPNVGKNKIEKANKYQAVLLNRLHNQFNAKHFGSTLSLLMMIISLLILIVYKLSNIDILNNPNIPIYYNPILWMFLGVSFYLILTFNLDQYIEKGDEK